MSENRNKALWETLLQEIHEHQGDKTSHQHITDYFPTTARPVLFLLLTSNLKLKLEYYSNRQVGGHSVLLKHTINSKGPPTAF